MLVAFKLEIFNVEFVDKLFKFVGGGCQHGAGRRSSLQLPGHGGIHRQRHGQAAF